MVAIAATKPHILGVVGKFLAQLRADQWVDAVQTVGIVVSTLILAYMANLLRLGAQNLTRDMRTVLNRQADIEARLKKLETLAEGDNPGYQRWAKDNPR